MQLDGGPSVVRYSLSEARTVRLGDDHVLLVYRADYARPGAGLRAAMLVGSVWRRQGPVWVNVFSQDTPLADAT